MPTTLTNGIQLPDKGSVDWYGSMQSNYNLIDTHLGDTDVHVTAEDKANWNSKQGSLSQDQLDAIAQVATITDDIATLQSGKADASHTHSSSDITDIDDYATKDYVDNSISGLVDNAPDALNTLNELSAALNDDSNFASTVTTALADKANSADLATVATSGSYNDLDDLPTIPTVNDATLTIQKNGVDVQTFTANASSNVTANITVPTKTSDLTNDSNFVDTSNAAVASGITSAKVTDYDTHIADTDIHVTTADKATWNTVTSKANDSDVVHKSGNETISGVKNFVSTLRITAYPSIGMCISDDEWNVQPPSNKQSEIRFTDKNSVVLSYFAFQHRADSTEPFRTCWRQQKMDGTSSYYSINFNNLGDFYPENDNAINLGKSGKRWANVYATNYYYGGSEIEFSTKFVTTDTNQTISGAKTFNSDLYVANTDTTANTPNLNLRNYKADRGTTDTAVQTISFLDKNAKALTLIESRRVSNGNTATNILTYNTDDSNNTVSGGIAIIKSKTDTNFAPNTDNAVTCGRALAKWSDVQTYKVNALEPSSLGMPDLDNGIDISSYITIGDTDNNYTPPANGWIWIRLIGNGAGIIQGDFGINANYVTNNLTNEKWVETNLFVTKDVQATIRCRNITGIIGAKFYPCQGNV